MAKLAWADTDTLETKRRAAQCQLLFLNSIGLSSPGFFFEQFDYGALEDFALAHNMLVWHKFDPSSHINLAGVDLPKPKHHLARNMRQRFPGTDMIHNHMRSPPAGLEDPNFVAAYDLATALMRKELKFGQEEVSYTLARNERIQQRTQKDPSEKPQKRWVGNPLFADQLTFDSLDVLGQVRTFTFTPEKFKYVLGAKGEHSFAKLLQEINAGTVNFRQSPERVALLWHIMGAKDSMFEGVLEWIEMLVPLISPAQIPEEHKLFFSQIADSMAKVQNGYKLLNEKLSKLRAIKKGEKLTDYEIKKMMNFLLQHFPLKALGSVLEDRKRKRLNPAFPSTFPPLYKKAFGLSQNLLKQTFSQSTPVSTVQSPSAASANPGNFGFATRAQVQAELKYAQTARARQKKKNQNSRKRKRAKLQASKVDAEK